MHRNESGRTQTMALVAIVLAGGLTPDGSDGRLKVVRQVSGKSKEDKIKLDEPVKPGDTVVVRRRLF